MRKICKNTHFRWSVFSRRRTEFTIVSLNRKNGPVKTGIVAYFTQWALKTTLKSFAKLFEYSLVSFLYYSNYCLEIILVDCAVRINRKSKAPRYRKQIIHLRWSRQPCTRILKLNNLRNFTQLQNWQLPNFFKIKFQTNPQTLLKRLMCFSISFTKFFGAFFFFYFFAEHFPRLLVYLTEVHCYRCCFI